MLRPAAALLTALATAACTSSYMPRTPGRVAVIIDGGTPTYVRDGQKYPHGFLGGGLADAVRGNKPAEDAASEYRSRLGTGLLVTLGGAVCVTAAGISGLAKAVDEQAPNPTTELWVMLGCSVAMLGGALYAVSAEPYRWDAINIFNDSYAPAPYPYPYPPPVAPTGAPGARLAPLPRETVSLRMRD